MKLSAPTVLVDHTFLLGENPLWDARRQELFWTDIDAGELWRYDPATKGAIPFYSGPVVGGFTLQHDGSLALFRERDIARLDPDGGQPARSIAPFTDPDAKRFNDVLALPDGSVYAGTIAARPGSGGLYHISQGLTIRRLFQGTDVSNGMALRSAGKSLLWTCSTSRRVYEYQRDPETNDLGERSPIYRTTEAEGIPDGLTLDRQGRIWSARWDGSSVIVHAPDGSPIHTIEFPVPRVTSVCFGGMDLSTLFVTTSGGPLFAVQTDTQGCVEDRSALHG